MRRWSRAAIARGELWLCPELRGDGAPRGAGLRSRCRLRSRAKDGSVSPCGAPPTPVDPPAAGAAILRRAKAVRPSLRRAGPRIRAGRECEAGRGACARTAKPVRVSQSRARPWPDLKTRRFDTAVLPRKPDDASVTGRVQAELARRRLHSVACRKRHLPVVGADGPPRLPGSVCASHARGRRASFHFTNASGSAPMNEVIGIYAYKKRLSRRSWKSDWTTLNFYWNIK